MSKSNNILLKPEIKNTYLIEKVDLETGTTEELSKFHNIVLWGFWDYHSPTLFIGDGNSKEPAFDDAELEHFIFDRTYAESFEGKITELSHNKAIIERVFMLPRGPYYSGEIKELGLGVRVDYPVGSYRLTTRALVRDSQNQKTSIVKTADDTFKITIYMEVTLNINAPYHVYPPKSNLFFLYIARGASLCMKTFPLLLLWDNTQIESNQSLLFSYAGKIDCSIAERPYIDTPYLEYRYNKTRFNTSNETPIRYINALSVVGFCQIDFPNEDLFPPMLLENMTVGVGDGSKKEFKCPLSLFMKDTERVYKNGVLLTRGVDYTIDNENNQDKLVEISLGNLATITGGILQDDYNIVYDQYGDPVVMQSWPIRGLFKYAHPTRAAEFLPLFRKAGKVVGNLSKENPILFTCKTPQKANYIEMDDDRAWNNPQLLYTLSYSNNNKNFIKIGSFKQKMNFNTVTAQYWKLETNVDAPDYKPSRAAREFLGYIGKGIVFSVPPAQNEKITMDAQVDRPVYNNNVKIDSEFSLKFSVPPAPEGY